MPYEFNQPGEFTEMLKPEVPETGREEEEKTENGEPLKYKILNEKDQIIYQREHWYKKGEVPSPDSLGGDRHQFFTYDEQGRKLEEVGQTLSTKEGDPKHQNQWRETHAYDDERGTHTVTGKIECGKDAGHEWQITYEEQDLGNGRKMVIETNEILEQGQNSEKPEKGMKTEKRKYFDENGAWVGNREKNLTTDEQYPDKLAKGVEKFPDWTV